jgi:hypothetical protein
MGLRSLTPFSGRAYSLVQLFSRHDTHSLLLLLLVRLYFCFSFREERPGKTCVRVNALFSQQHQQF